MLGKIMYVGKSKIIHFRDCQNSNVILWNMLCVTPRYCCLDIPTFKLIDRPCVNRAVLQTVLNLNN